jgi:hypothetical protein
MKPILCIDPGASGGLALLNREGIVEAFPMRDGMTGQEVAGIPFFDKRKTGWIRREWPT